VTNFVTKTIDNFSKIQLFCDDHLSSVDCCCCCCCCWLSSVWVVNWVGQSPTTSNSICRRCQ